MKEFEERQEFGVKASGFCPAVPSFRCFLKPETVLKQPLSMAPSFPS